MFIEELDLQLDPWHIYKNIYSYPYSFMLDSSSNLRGREQYSFLGFDPFLTIKAKGKRIELLYDGERKEIIGNPIHTLNLILKTHSVSFGPNRFSFQSGAVGFMGYDLRHAVEKLPEVAKENQGIPDLVFGLYDRVFIYDNLLKKGYILSTGLPERNNRNRRERAKERLKEFKKSITTLSLTRETDYHKKDLRTDDIVSNFTQDDYIKAIEQALDYISAGDVYQINLSQRFSVPLSCHPLYLYERLRKINSTPMGAFLNLGDLQILSNSPERFFKIRGEIIETYPIKGTKRRGTSIEEDRQLIHELRTDAKEKAEHLMIVDLERNDLGKICRYGSVMVEELNRIDTYSTLHHMVSKISGRLKEETEISAVIKALFPGGSITGTPKVRAMEIIDELEPDARGVYTGAIGYIDFSGNADFNMAIRTAIQYKDMIYYQSGGGIVTDSNPKREYEETLLKAQVFFSAMRGTALAQGTRGQSLFYDSAMLRP